ncbi:winged helix-turn-helix transcriptional regulator [Pseudobacteriovorax antillogorgiicola]|uniref:Transcriptional regulator, HxlR family n=1 Tax=Pseudobacteriovorax antillogorgiicola TaxID=1513793 RepID=A0A1Y6CJS7_9BACT|nr:helix-turn-helix domain-containing protein [Pseudobacteriovorax antillogorgiicola]TCS47976.1 HxlR family transcriptional regulator [Pseudobacteriovorax antillogorgiicola]SMF58248.1 transcriptional regulator, HxlR family [Pseudobacteriovorax antillogorgiicola]
MAKRSYQQNCSLAFALDLLGERWTLLIIRDLLPGPRRFGTLHENLAGLGTNLLTTRLKELQQAGLVEKVSQGLHEGYWQLTAYGRDLEPIVVALAKWGLHLAKDRFSQENHWSPMWNYVACRARFQPDKCQEASIIGQFDIDGYVYWLQIESGDFTFSEGDHPKPDFKLMTQSEPFNQFLVGDYAFDDFVDKFVIGNSQQFAHCIQCFI